MNTIEFKLGGREYCEYAVAGQLVHVFFYADAPLGVYLVDQQNHSRFKARKRFVHHGPGLTQQFNKTLALPNSGPWRLIIENRSFTPTSFGFGAV